MKKLLFIGLLLIQAAVYGLEKGTSRTAVIAELGEPDGSMQRDGKEILLFKTGTVTLQDGVVVEADVSKKYAKEAEERALKAKKKLAEQQAALEKQKLLCPEDCVAQIDCAYSKTEDWKYLPEILRPATGEYRYNVFIPQGYYESDRRHYPCLFLESPVLWNSVKDRMHNDKWIVIILPAVAQAQMGTTLNGNFLAAYDDAIKQFRIDSEHVFFAGKIPTAIFATMRPSAGIILHEPDFKGFEKADFHPDFLRLNSNLRACVLLGNNNRDNVIYQGEYIKKQIPKRYIVVYEGYIDIIPQTLADNAFDWMKKEYNLP